MLMLSVLQKISRITREIFFARIGRLISDGYVDLSLLCAHFVTLSLGRIKITKLQKNVATADKRLFISRGKENEKWCQ